MVWFILKHIFSTFCDLINIRQLTDQEKDLEILILRQQLSILQRKINHPIKPSRAEKLTLAVLTAKLKAVTERPTRQLQDIIRIFQPETVLRWHRKLVRRKWTYQRKNKGGRPPTDKELEDLILRLARENPRWGYGKIHGELLKLGCHTSEPNVGNILKRNGIQPAPVRNGSIGWRHLMNHYKDQILACDMFTVETEASPASSGIWLQTIFVLFFIELGSRRVHFAGLTTNPHQIWITQQARQLVWDLTDEGSSLRFLIHDNDSSFSKAFDTVFISEGYHVIHTPFQAPNANAFAERWIRSAREECLDHILILGSAHLQRVLIEFVAYYNLSRPHQGIEQRIPGRTGEASPIPQKHSICKGSIQKNKVLGGIINAYYRAPTDTALAVS
jgi:hypothetical protein